MTSVLSVIDTIAEERSRFHARLMANSHGLKNDDLLACMLSSRCVDIGGMPYHLGLDNDNFSHMMKLHFPQVELPLTHIVTEIGDPQRFAEQEELRDLLLAHRADDTDDSVWMADIVTAGCMGGNHLWQDMGLWSRQDLSHLMQLNFPALAAKNDRDMKWKKFLYKQLCIAEGIYVCRSPSCEVCPDYQGCFGPEED